MAAIHYNTSVPAAGADRAVVSLTERVQSIYNWVVKYRAMRRAERDLLALDDRLLNDIGIERSNVHQMVWKGRQGR